MPDALMLDLVHIVRAHLAASGGDTLPEKRNARRALSAVLKGFDPATVIRLAQELIEGDVAPRWFVYEILNHRSDVIEMISASEVEALGEGIATWDQVDAFACFVSGPAWRDGQLSTADIVRWSKMHDRWWRRASIVSTVALNNSARGGRGDAARTLALCSRLVDDRDDMVVKAMSWALRELAKKDEVSATAFIAEHSDRLAPRVLREVANKIRTGLKTP